MTAPNKKVSRTIQKRFPNCGVNFDDIYVSNNHAFVIHDRAHKVDAYRVNGHVKDPLSSSIINKFVHKNDPLIAKAKLCEWPIRIVYVGHHRQDFRIREATPILLRFGDNDDEI